MELSYERRKKCVVSNKTRFVIAYRLSTILQVDQILVVEDGNITGVGTYEKLMENHAYYKKLYNSNLW
ncbi:hypothetical protein WAX78_23665 [Bacillus sp. FJAT-53711]|uniref:ABC transporter ATP-binding protein n=1 Tax=Bacillus yunxiaonensis TaxID=3127665 RepID=A0ABU8G4N3_9BACI